MSGQGCGGCGRCCRWGSSPHGGSGRRPRRGLGSWESQCMWPAIKAKGTGEGWKQSCEVSEGPGAWSLGTDGGDRAAREVGGVSKRAQGQQGHLQPTACSLRKDPETQRPDSFSRACRGELRGSDNGVVHTHCPKGSVPGGPVGRLVVMSLGRQDSCSWRVWGGLQGSLCPGGVCHTSLCPSWALLSPFFA